MSDTQASAPRKASPPKVKGKKGHFAVGKVVGVHGLKGEVKVDSYTDFPERFAAGAVLVLGDELEPLTVRESRPHKGHLLVGFEEIEGRDDAETLRGEWLYVPEHAASELGENVYWVHDILGMKVISDEGVALGVVDDVLFTGANEVYVVHRGVGKPDLLLPATDEVIRIVDVPGRRLTVHLIPGLLD
jgi:16S rRNA processing protein RimM